MLGPAEEAADVEIVVARRLHVVCSREAAQSAEDLHCARLRLQLQGLGVFSMLHCQMVHADGAQVLRKAALPGRPRCRR